ncbi:DUF1992 domain-containing protein [Microbacterium sp. 4R-513]|uniref:DnaJ family domain-containing protein n=1 Tax=Microbacterium sp. 4R-513 TaxID=2567934 RepID=UPI0013E1613C|nr:DUF1992 domain-containing protein [Microbacterium sp. 4R-513]QIG39623.1 DUF1992 domain-containing protein [Microbacterium sp. 4R-513]
MTEDPREAAERYRLEKWRREHEGEEEAGAEEAAPEGPQRGSSAAERAAYVETAIQQAIRRGEFDDLPGAGKPLEGLGERHDPDWWIRRKIEQEQLRGLGPPALTLRVEHNEMEQRLDDLKTEGDVREYLEDFNKRVIEARRQLLGGPPVVTPTRDVDEEIARWHERRSARTSAEAATVAEAEASARRRRWRMRRRRVDG